MLLLMTVTLLLGPPPKSPIRTPFPCPSSMEFATIVMLLLPSSTPTCEPTEPVIVLLEMEEPVVLKKRTPLPLLVMVFPYTDTKDCDPGRVEARFTAGPLFPEK